MSSLGHSQRDLGSAVAWICLFFCSTSSPAKKESPSFCPICFAPVCWVKRLWALQWGNWGTSQSYPPRARCLCKIVRAITVYLVVWSKILAAVLQFACVYASFHPCRALGEKQRIILIPAAKLILKARRFIIPGASTSLWFTVASFTSRGKWGW